MARTLLALGLGLVAACAHTTGAPKATFAPSAREALARFEAHDYAAATASLERALAANPGDDEITYLLALARTRMGDRPGALKWLARLADDGSDLVPTDRDFHDLAGEPEFAPIAARLADSAGRHRRSTEAFRVPEMGLMSEGIAYDPIERTFYLGSIRRRKIVKVAEGRAPVDFLAPRPDLDGVNGLRVDPKRRRLWAASEADESQDGFTPADRGRSALFEIDLTTGGVLAVHRPSGPGEHGLNDVALDASGRPYVTDSPTGQVYALGEDGGALVPVFAAPPFRYPNGITFDDEGKTLFVADSVGVHVVEVRAGTEKLLRQPVGVSLAFFDGLYFARTPAGPRLVGVQTGGGPGRVVAAALDPALDAVVQVEILESDHPAFDGPTTGAIAGSFLYVIANSQLGSKREASETVILRTPLSDGLGARRPDPRRRPP